MESRYELESELKPFLLTDERFEWVAKPSDVPLFTKKDYALVPFGLFFACFALFWMYMASQGSIIFALFGLPFLAIGIGIAFVRPYLVRKMHLESVYGLTDTSLIIKTRLFKTQVSSFELANIAISRIDLNDNGSGTIRLIHPNMIQHRRVIPALKNIKDPKEVHRKLSEFIERAKKGNS